MCNSRQQNLDWREKGVALVKPQANFCALGVAAQCGVPHLPRIQGQAAWITAQEGGCRKRSCSRSLDTHEPFLEGDGVPWTRTPAQGRN